MSHCCNETVSPQCCFNTVFDAPAKSVAAFPMTIPIFSGQKILSISKNTSWNKTKHFIGCPLRNVYIMLREIKTAGFFLWLFRATRVSLEHQLVRKLSFRWLSEPAIYNSWTISSSLFPFINVKHACTHTHAHGLLAAPMNCLNAADSRFYS